MDTSTIIAICGLALAFITFFLGQKQGAKKEGAETARVLEKLISLDDKVEEIKAEMKSANLAGLVVRTDKLEKEQEVLKRTITKHLETHVKIEA